MKIIVVLSDLRDSGAQRISLQRAARWQAAGDDVTIFVASGDVDPRLTVPSELTVRRATRQPRKLRVSLPLALVKLVLLVRRSDVVVSGTEIGIGLLLAWCAARLVRRPFAVTVQSQPQNAITFYVAPRLRRFTRAALQHCDLAVCVAQGLVSELEHLGLEPRRIAAVANAVDHRAVLAKSTAEPPGFFDGSRPVVVASGRLVHQKGFDLLIRAHALVRQGNGIDHQLLVLGEGEDRHDLARMANEQGVGDSVTMPGFTENPHAVVARASVYVVASRWEGFPLGLVEALACRTPCIAFDCVTGPAEVLGGGEFGKLVPPGDVSALAEAIRAHLVDPVQLCEAAQRATDRHSAIFDADHAADLHRAALANLVTAPR